MPLIVFIGVSSLGALFLILVFAELCRDGHCRSRTSVCCLNSTAEERGRAMRSDSSTTRMLPLAIATRNHRTKVMVLRQTIGYSEPNRPKRIPKDAANASERDMATIPRRADASESWTNSIAGCEASQGSARKEFSLE